jgi:hypothetical protein
LKIPQIIDITDDLPKRGKTGWDALNKPRDINALTDIAWHHTAEFEDDDISPETHANNHIRAGEGGFPYHFYIKKGTIYQGNDILTFTYGIKSNNYQTVHCSVEGCYAPDKGRPADELSDENLRAMIGLELTLRQVLPAYKKTNGHNYYDRTLCPGYSMTKFRESILEIEKKIEWKNTSQYRSELAFRIANSILWTRNTSMGIDQFGKTHNEDGTPTVKEEHKAWAVDRLLLLEPKVRELGFLFD